MHCIKALLRPDIKNIIFSKQKVEPRVYFLILFIIQWFTRHCLIKFTTNISNLRVFLGTYTLVNDIQFTILIHLLPQTKLIQFCPLQNGCLVYYQETIHKGYWNHFSSVSQVCQHDYAERPYSNRYGTASFRSLTYLKKSRGLRINP